MGEEGVDAVSWTALTGPDMQTARDQRDLHLDMPAAHAAEKTDVSARDFLISYAQPDRQWAEWIAWQLESAGHRVFFAGWDMVPGSRWTAFAEATSRRARRTIVVVSRACATDGRTAAEWATGCQRDLDGSPRALIPIRVEECRAPAPLDGITACDLFGLTSRQARRRLLECIRAATTGRSKPASAPTFPGPRRANRG